MKIMLNTTPSSLSSVNSIKQQTDFGEQNPPPPFYVPHQTILLLQDDQFSSSSSNDSNHLQPVNNQENNAMACIQQIGVPTTSSSSDQNNDHHEPQHLCVLQTVLPLSLPLPLPHMPLPPLPPSMLVEPSSAEVMPDNGIQPPPPPLHSCWSCGFPILERYLLSIQGEGFFLHEQCLKCTVCAEPLSDRCFVRDGRVYCRDDYYKLFGTKCGRCGIGLRPDDYVLRSGPQLVFHVDCFCCAYCGQQLQKDDRYFCIEGVIICQRDYNLMHLQRHIAEATNRASSIGEGPFLGPGGQIQPPQLDFGGPHLALTHGGHHHHHDRLKKIPKRPRTILNAPQRKAFKLAFEKGSKPSRKVREQLGRETGLSVRVVQVWFQNQRAKIKKDQRKRDTCFRNGGETRRSVGSRMSINSNTKSEMDDETRTQSDSFSKTELDSEVDELESADEEGGGDEAYRANNSASEEKQQHSNNEYLQQTTVQQQQSTAAGILQVELSPIEKLYHMHQTYFTVA